MAQQNFWRGFNTAVLSFAVLTLCYWINIYLFGVTVTVVSLALLHHFLVNIRDYLQRKQQLRKVKGTSIAIAVFPDDGKIVIRFLEIRQHVGVRYVKHDWLAAVGSTGMAKGNMILNQTRTPDLTKNQALAELQRMLVKELVKRAAEMPAATGVAQ